MIKTRAGRARKTLATLLATALVVAGLGLVGYSLLAAGSPASADDPGGVHGRISEELEAKFHRSIPERIVAGIRGDERTRIETPENKELRLTVPGMKRVDGVPVYDAPESGYDKALSRGSGAPTSTSRATESATLGPRATSCSGTSTNSRRGMRSTSPTPTGPATLIRSSRNASSPPAKWASCGPCRGRT
jgi:hypothetical protein